ncbi:nitroreductase family protein [Phascolarctobacterium faecium]
MDTLTAIATRRSTRVYKPEQISDSQLQTVLAAGWASPVGHGAYDELYISVVQIPKFSKTLQNTVVKLSETPNTIRFTAPLL